MLPQDFENPERFRFIRLFHSNEYSIVEHSIKEYEEIATGLIYHHALNMVKFRVCEDADVCGDWQSFYIGTED